jgi:Animal haem peroxidase
MLEKLRTSLADSMPATPRESKPLNKLEITHGHATREMTPASLRALSGHGDPGKFGRMFPALDPLFVQDDALAELAAAMKDPDPASASGNNTNIPAGYTYLGQFIDHDITLDLTPLDEQEVDPLATQNFRSPGLDLDSLYGPGPALAPYMYQRDTKGRLVPKFLIGRASASNDQDGNPVAEMLNDLPRTSHGRAVIGDERNDENLLVAQTHLAFLKFHNAVIDWLATEKPTLGDTARYDEARRIVTWHYQWIALYDFVERLTEPGLVNEILHQGRRFYRFKTRPYMPVEFAAAAYRIGHSMVREAYSHNRVFRPGGLAPGSLDLLFFFTGKSGAIIGDLAASANAGDFPPLGAQATLPSNWVIDWRRFYDFGTAAGGDFRLNPSRLLDPFLVPALHTLPGESDRFAMLPFRNLRRGVILELPSGQDVAKAMGETPLAPADIERGPDGAAAAAHGLHQKTPLWYYILKEAEVLHQGTRLGPVGSTIIAEVFLGLVHGDHQSFLWQRSNWKPELPRAADETFTMVDMLNFVGDLNPVG